MQAILKLDVSGQPRGWLTLNEAVTAYARGDVLYGIGESLPLYSGVSSASPAFALKSCSNPSSLWKAG